MLFDTHTHIYLCTKHQEKEIIDGMKQNQVSKIVSIWVDLDSSKISINLAKAYPNIVYSSVWIHPNDCKDLNLLETIWELEKMILENKKQIVAIWETGFDFYHDDRENTLENQENFFKSQIFLAKKYNLPFIVHSRNAKKDTLRVLKECNYNNFILHCFSEDLEFALECINFAPNCKISFSWIVTYKSALSIQETAWNIPLKNIIIETDCPFLSPQEVRGQENIPEYIRYILKKIIELRQLNWKSESGEEIENIFMKIV